MSRLSPRAQLNVVLASGLVMLAGVILMHVPGVAAGLAYLAPGLLVFLLLGVGRFPGEKAILAVIRARRGRRSRSVAARCRPVWRRVARGGGLLATALAGRAPPRSARLL